MSRALLFLFIFNIISCKSYKSLPDHSYRYPTKINTADASIINQVKRVYLFRNGIAFHNFFKGAKLDYIEQIGDASKFILYSIPENQPINSSPWYAFKFINPTSDTIDITFNYGGHRHRYHPKVRNSSSKEWKPVSSDQCYFDQDSTFHLLLPPSIDTLTIAAQPLFTTDHLLDWLSSLNQVPYCTVTTIGKSREDRDLFKISLSKRMKKKKTIVFFSRQHPPEVTGQIALINFINELTTHLDYSKLLDSYNVLIYPMINPDGVDAGHWRHNLGGRDLNRDWALYNQQEVATVARDIYKLVHKYELNIVLGVDFHSTFDDVYYTNVADSGSKMPNFTSQWLEYIKKNISGYHPKVAPSNIGAPVSKNWFYINFKAVGITYEIGDDTSIEFIQEKAKVSVDGLIKLLLTSQ